MARMETPEPRKRSKTPATVAVGLALTLLVTLGLLTGGEMTPIGIVLLLVGVALLCTGLIQRTLEARR